MLWFIQLDKLLKFIFISQTKTDDKNFFGLRMRPENKPNYTYLIGNEFLQKKRNSFHFKLFMLYKNYQILKLELLLMRYFRWTNQYF